MSMPSTARTHRLSPVALAVTLALASLPASAPALVALSEEELSSVEAQDGLTNTLAGTLINATRIGLSSDSGANLGEYHAEGLRLAPTGVGGDPTALSATFSLDVGSTQLNAGGLPGIDLTIDVAKARLGGAGANGWLARMTAEPARSFGHFALVSDFEFNVNGRPFFGSPTSDANITLALNDATIFYRQFDYPNASLAFDNANFLWKSPGTVDIDSQGLVISAPVATLEVEFDAKYKYHADQDLNTITANDRPMVRFSWGGTLYDGLLRLRSGGIWDTAVDNGTTATFAAPPAGRTEGILVSMRWNYRDALNNNDFLWSVGNLEGDQEYIQFGDWKNLENANGAATGRYGFEFPVLAIDAVNAGSATNAGGSLCWGAQATTAALCATNGGTALNIRAGTVEGYTASVNRSAAATSMHIIRNAQLLSYSNQIRIYRNPTAPVEEGGPYNWGLIYTLGNINQNVYIYPGGSESDTAGGSRNHGAIVDLLMMTQSFGNYESNILTTSGGGPCNAGTGVGCTNTLRWSEGTHFLLADTDAQMGIGFIGSRFLVASDDMRIWVRNTPNGETHPFNYEGGLDLFSPRTRAHMVTLFGGVRLPRGHDLVRGAFIDMNLEGLWNFRLSPPPKLAVDNETNDYLAFSAALRLRCGSVIPFGCSDNAFAASTGSTFASGSGSYLSIAEPGFTGVDFRLSDMSGDVAWTEGVIQLRSGTDTASDIAPGSPDQNTDGKPELVLASKLLLGASAGDRITDAVIGSSVGNGGVAGRTLTANASFGGNSMWSIAIPAGSFYSAFTLLPQ